MEEDTTPQTADLGSPAVPSDSHQILRFVARRIASSLVTLALISVIVFLSISLLGGDSASVLLGRDATPARLEAARHTLGLDQPLYQRYVTWLTNFLRGDFGATSASRLADHPEAIRGLVREPIINSSILAGLTFIITAPVALWMGVRSGLRGGTRTDRFLSSLTMGLASLPEFVVGTLLIYLFFYVLGWFPPVSLVAAGSSPFERPQILVLPVMTLGLGLLAVMARQIRAAVIDVAQQPYVQAARLNGYREKIVVRRFILRNSLAPSTQVMALVLIYLFGGVIVIERVFAYPGIGDFLVRAVTEREVAVLQAVTMMVAVLSVALSLLADLATLLLVPKLRGGR